MIIAKGHDGPGEEREAKERVSWGSKHMSHCDDKHPLQLWLNTVWSPLMDQEEVNGMLMKLTGSLQ